MQHGRMNEGPTAERKALHRKHLARVAAMPCLVCGRPATVHHVSASINGGRTITRSDECVAPLCPVHHQKVYDPSASDPISVEGLGHGGFYREHGINLLAVATKLWLETVNHQ